MSADSLAIARLHELVKDPVRQKILLKLGESEDLSLDALLRELKMDDQQEVLNQLTLLGDLVSKTEDDYSLSEQGVTKRAGGQYKLTEKGIAAVSEMIAYPEIASENYQEKIEKNFHSEQAIQRNKILAVLLGAFLGLCVCYFGTLLLPFSAHHWIYARNGFLGLSWSFLITWFVISPTVGGFFGYWLGRYKDFKRPEPEWND
jgi:hypothetical protein